VLELSGSTCSGKTQLLYLITVLSTLPKVINGQEFGGKAASVVILDTDGRYDVRRLTAVMNFHIRTILTKQSPEAEEMTDDDISLLIFSSLAHVHIFRPQSTSSLLSTIDSLPGYLLSRSAHMSANRVLSTIILDGASTFYYTDKMEDETLSNTGEGVTSYNQTIVNTAIINRLQDLATQFSCAVIFTSHAPSPAKPSRDGSALFRPQALSSPWHNFATLTLKLSRVKPAKFVPGLSAEEALVGKQARWDVVKRGEFEAKLGVKTIQGREEWSRDVKDALRKAGRGRSGEVGFSFWVRDVGVGLDEDEDNDEVEEGHE
jgi:Rad51